MKKTKIVCSIGPASSKPEVMSKMVEAGMNIARINFSHATDEEKETVVKSVKEVREITGKNIGILFDTKGPEFRSGMLLNDTITLKEGKTIRLVKEDVLGTEESISVNYKTAIDSLKVGDIVLIENGLMELVVKTVEADGVTCLIISGGVLGNKKSMSVPGVKLDIPFISEQDKKDILYAATHEGDYLALSFVSTKEDVLAVRELLRVNKCEGILLISKIESQTGIDNLEEIIEVSDGIMVARGDLGVEVEMSLLPYEQSNMIEKCREHGKMVIVATEMLESMKKNIRPTRAEVSDVTAAVLSGTDAVMLSGETTTGMYPVETVTAMARICKTAEKNYKNKYKLNEEDFKDVRAAICKSAVHAAKNLNAKLIVTPTISGATAKYVSNLIPTCPVLAAVTSDEVKRHLSLNHGVYPVLVNKYESTDEIVNDSIRVAKEFMDLLPGDIIVITGGFPNNDVNNVTNFIKIEVI